MGIADYSQSKHLADRVEKVFIWTVFLYCALRFFLVDQFLSQYKVNPWIFGAIDLATAWPYAVGWAKTVRAGWEGDYWSSLRWAVVVLLAFLAPYLYIGIAAHHMPPEMWTGIIIFAGIMGALGAIKLYSVLKLSKKHK